MYNSMCEESGKVQYGGRFRVLLDDQFSDLDFLYFPCGHVGKEEETAQKEEDRDQDRLRPILRNEVRDTDASKDRTQCPARKKNTQNDT